MPDASDPRGTAYHEAGHCVICLLKGGRIRYVTIRPGADEDGRRYAGRTAYQWPGSPVFSGKNCRALIAAQLAGGVAERLAVGKAADLTSCRIDAEKIAAHLANRGLDAAQAGALVAEFLPETIRLVLANWFVVAAVARALIESEELSGPEVVAIVRAARWKQAVSS